MVKSAVLEDLVTRINLIFILLFLYLASSCTVKRVVSPDDVLGPGEPAVAIRDVLRHGDWLVARGIHAADNFISTVTNMPLSHAAIYDAEKNEVIESESMGVHETPLAEFLAKSHRVLVIRPIWHTEENAVIAVARARSWIGKKYNFTGLVGINTPDRYYCSQLALEAYRPFIMKNSGNPIPKVISPGRMYHWGRIMYDSGP